MKFLTALKYLTVITPLVVTGCGGGISGSSFDDDEEVASETGVFIDSAVGGIDYQTQSLSGRTNAAGEFAYVDGETVIFSIGDFDFPPVAAGELITPLTIFDTQEVGNSAVLNMARLLQSLDTDGDPDNGITIGEDAHGSATGLIVSFSSATFEADVANLVANSGSVNTSLISEADALAHLQQTLADFGLRGVIGSWYIDGALLTFVDDNNYFVTQDADPGELFCSDGMEYGSYNWNADTGSLILSNTIDTTGECGFAAMQGDSYEATAVVNGDSLTITDEEGNITLARVADDNNPLIGGWYLDGNNKTLVTFINATDYFVTQDIGDNEPTCTDGMEKGTYTLSAGMLNANNLDDTTGGCGFTENPGEDYAAALELEGNTLTITDGEGPFVFTAVR